MKIWPIQQVVVYKGHEKNPIFGPYYTSVHKRIEMFTRMNAYRKEIGRPAWEVIPEVGERMIDVLKEVDPKRTLLVIPAGESSNLDKVFSVAETSFLKSEFFMKGGRGYFNCGSAYFISRDRIYNDLCMETVKERKTILKTSRLPLFEGIAVGPHSRFPGREYRVGFVSDAARVTNGSDVCTFYLSGGGSFSPYKSAQKVKVLAKYLPTELMRFGKPLPECEKWENAGIMVSVGEDGAAVLSSFHPYYGADDIDVEAYQKAFPDCGTDWKAMKKSLSPEDERMRFVLNSMLTPLEDLEF